MFSTKIRGRGQEAFYTEKKNKEKLNVCEIPEFWPLFKIKYQILFYGRTITH
jgi:hypothetical protein